LAKKLISKIITQHTPGGGASIRDRADSFWTFIERSTIFNMVRKTGE
ncbi:MAG: hypothetical protein ACI8RD_011365, partial [Bacillariaceae sp.]